MFQTHTSSGSSAMARSARTSAITVTASMLRLHNVARWVVHTNPYASHSSISYCAWAAHPWGCPGNLNPSGTLVSTRCTSAARHAVAAQRSAAQAAAVVEKRAATAVMARASPPRPDGWQGLEVAGTVRRTANPATPVAAQAKSPAMAVTARGVSAAALAADMAFLPT